MRKKILCMLLIFAFWCITAYAHSGRTDSNGGHFNRVTGEYHYHHGYTAHQHEKGICPYSFEDKTRRGNSTSSSVIITNSSQDEETNEGTSILLEVIKLFLALAANFVGFLVICWIFNLVYIAIKQVIKKLRNR